MLLYHRTYNSKDILAGGFRDGKGSYGPPAVLLEQEGWSGPDIEACRQAFAYRRQLRDNLDWKGQLYHVHGRYVCVYPDGRESGEIGLSTEQRAKDAAAAIQQAARASAAEFGYQGITWLSVRAELVKE